MGNLLSLLFFFLTHPQWHHLIEVHVSTREWVHGLTIVLGLSQRDIASHAVCPLGATKDRGKRQDPRSPESHSHNHLDTPPQPCYLAQQWPPSSLTWGPGPAWTWFVATRHWSQASKTPSSLISSGTVIPVEVCSAKIPLSAAPGRSAACWKAEKQPDGVHTRLTKIISYQYWSLAVDTANLCIPRMKVKTLFRTESEKYQIYM